MNNLYALRDIFRSLTYKDMERFAHLLANNVATEDVDYDDVDPDMVRNFAEAILVALREAGKCRIASVSAFLPTRS